MQSHIESMSAAVSSEMNKMPADDVTHILKASAAAGVSVERIIGPWLEYCLGEKDLAGAREAIETCAAGLGLAPLAATWTWPQAMARSAKLREAMHISVYYQLDDALIAADNTSEADAVLRVAVAAMPQLSGPPLRLAQRLYDRKARAEADEMLTSFLKRSPGDIHAAGLMVRQAAKFGATKDSATVFRGALAAGVPVDQVIGPWIEAALKANDLAGARQAVSVAATALGLNNLGPDWTWPQVLANSEMLSAMHLSVYYMLDDVLIAAGKNAEADDVLKHLIAVNPPLSGPTMRLAQRYNERNEWAEGDKLLTGFLANNPADVSVALMFARRTAASGAHKDTIRVLKTALDAGAPAAGLVDLWLESAFKSSDMAGARRGIEAMAAELGLSPLDWSWTWPQVLGKSEALRRGLHLNLYYQLEDQHLAANDVAGADKVIRCAIDAYPQYSGPVLRLAQRLYARKEDAEANRILIAFLRRVPSDTHAATMFARYATRGRAAVA